MMQSILVIDDDAAVRGAFQLILEEVGFEVRVAEDGYQGVASAQDKRPDLIFLDLKMPGIDGVETMRRLLANDPSLTIYIVTAFSQDYMLELKQAQLEGLNFQLANKPLSSSQIRHIAKSVIGQHNIEEVAHKITLVLYVVVMNTQVQHFVNQLSQVLSSTYQPGYWTLEVVEVLGMPEKALEKNIFATPMLVREIPEPVLKLLGDLNKMPSVLAAITATNHEGTGTMVL